jgi:ribosomal protein L11 methyltransferase
MEYIGLDIDCNPEFTEIIVAELGEVGFDSFLENEAGLEAYCPKDLFNNEQMEEVFTRYNGVFEFEYAFKEIARVNWNEEWEKNYDPIVINNDIYVRATFHAPKPEFKYEIVIQPKMSFGTGHHSTTSMVLSNQMSIDHVGKTVLDAGTGTGILAVMAKMLGATSIYANDVDDWCIQNCQENVEMNNAADVKVLLGTVPQLAFESQKFDIVLANINKNVLLSELQEYARIIKTNGTLVLSGFYESDFEDINNKAKEVGFEFVTYKTLLNWCSPIFKKI